MTQTIIPAGYRLSVTSWENDADNYQTTVHEGLSKERVKYILELCKLFYSKNSPLKNKGVCFGNMYEPSDVQREDADDAIRAVMEKHRAVLNEDELEQLAVETDPEDEYSGPEFNYIVCEFLGYSEDYLYRVYDKATVEFIPQEIRIDVSTEFDV